MPVAARVVSDSLIVAAIASFEVSAERGRSASADIAQCLALLVRNHMAPALKELVLVSVKDRVESVLPKGWANLNRQSGPNQPLTLL
jgi:hypothetical protein